MELEARSYCYSVLQERVNPFCRYNCYVHTDRLEAKPHHSTWRQRLGWRRLGRVLPQIQREIHYRLTSLSFVFVFISFVCRDGMCLVVGEGVMFLSRLFLHSGLKLKIESYEINKGPLNKWTHRKVWFGCSFRGFPLKFCLSYTRWPCQPFWAFGTNNTVQHTKYYGNETSWTLLIWGHWIRKWHTNFQFSCSFRDTVMAWNFTFFN